MPRIAATTRKRLLTAGLLVGAVLCIAALTPGLITRWVTSAALEDVRAPDSEDAFTSEVTRIEAAWGGFFRARSLDRSLVVSSLPERFTDEAWPAIIVTVAYFRSIGLD